MSDEKTTKKIWFELRRAALLSLFVHLLGGLSLLIILSHGLQTNANLEDRLQFIVHHRTLWIAGWLPWNAAALCILYLFFCLRRAHALDKCSSDALLITALLLAAVAIVADLSAEAIEMAILPDFAEKALASGLSNSSFAQSFSDMSRSAVLLTGGWANGLYTIATILVSWATRHFYPKPIVLSGFFVGVSGLALSYSAFVDSSDGLFWSNVVLVPFILIWQMGIAIYSRRTGIAQT